MKLASAEGEPCIWCRRPMTCKGTFRNRTSRLAGLRPTRDHYVPKSAGGRRCVIACQACNHVRGDMTVDMWTLFRAQTPNWWTLFETKGPRGKNLFYRNPENAELQKWEDVVFPIKKVVNQ